MRGGGAPPPPQSTLVAIAGRGTVLTGKLERGTIKRGDKVAISGYDQSVSAVVSGIETFHKTVEKAEPGDQLGLLLRGLSPKDARRGIVVTHADNKPKITDRVKAQLYVLKTEEGGSKVPIANYFQEHLFSLTWDTGATVKVVGKDFIMPGENGECVFCSAFICFSPHCCFRIELALNNCMFIEPQQRFTIRKDQTTVGTGVFVEPMAPRTDEEKDRRALKKKMKAEMERLGFNPYGETFERRLKPDYSQSPKDTTMSKHFE